MQSIEAHDCQEKFYGGPTACRVWVWVIILGDEQADWANLLDVWEWLTTYDGSGTPNVGGEG